VCEDVLHSDAEVPQEEFNTFLNELETERAGCDLELRKFEFVRNDVNQTTAPSPTGKKQKGRKGG
jgi:hypothetical protein